jgi:hypothetical protein
MAMTMMQIHEFPFNANAKAKAKAKAKVMRPSAGLGPRRVWTVAVCVGALLGCCALAHWRLQGRDGYVLNADAAHAISAVETSRALPYTSAPHSTELAALSPSRDVAAGTSFAAFSQWSAIDLPARHDAHDQISASHGVSLRIALIESTASRRVAQAALDELGALAAQGNQLALSAYLRYGEEFDGYTERAMQLLYVNAARGSVFALMTLANWSRIGVGLSGPDVLSAVAFDYMVWRITPDVGDEFQLVPSREQSTEDFQKSLALVSAWCANNVEAQSLMHKGLRAEAPARSPCS